MKYFLLLLVFACASDFRNPKKDMLICSYSVFEHKKIEAPTTYVASPVRFTWNELKKYHEPKIFTLRDRLKVFIPTRYREIVEQHVAVVVYDYFLLDGHDLKKVKASLLKSLKSNKNLTGPPKIDKTWALKPDVIIFTKKGSVSRSFDTELSEDLGSVSRVYMQNKGGSTKADGAFCLTKLEADPPQQSEEEEFKMELLRIL